MSWSPTWWRPSRRCWRNHVVDHDIQVELLWPAGIRPAWRLVVRRELEGYARRRIVPGDDREVRFLPRDRQAEQFRVEGGEGRRIRAVDDHVMQASDHGRDPAM